jgi:hypothetical protein
MMRLPHGFDFMPALLQRRPHLGDLLRRAYNAESLKFVNIGP